MRIGGVLLLLALLCGSMAVPASANDGLTVPATLAEIPDAALRDAVKAHSPSYDELGRGSQVFTYVHVYQWLNDGRNPGLDPTDTALLREMERREPTEIHSLEVPIVDASSGMDGSAYVIMSEPDWFDNPVLEAENPRLEPVVAAW